MQEKRSFFIRNKGVDITGMIFGIIGAILLVIAMIPLINDGEFIGILGIISIPFWIISLICTGVLLFKMGNSVIVYEDRVKVKAYHKDYEIRATDIIDCTFEKYMVIIRSRSFDGLLASNGLHISNIKNAEEVVGWINELISSNNKNQK